MDKDVFSFTRRNATSRGRRSFRCVSALASVPLLLLLAGTAQGTACTVTGGSYSCAGTATATENLTGAPLDITTEAGFGITTLTGNAFTLAGTGGLTFTDAQASTISGFTLGISAANTGAGDLKIVSNGTVIGGGAGTSGYGIMATNGVGSGKLSITANNVSGSYGIRASNSGSGITEVVASGAVTGRTAEAIYLTNTAAGGNVSVISTGMVIGGTHGISASQSGAAGISIHASGEVKANAGNGIRATTTTVATGDLNITADADVSGTSYGMYVSNSGTGNVAVKATGLVTATGIGTGAGIYASGDVKSGNLLIEAADANSATTGVRADNKGIGSTTIKVTGTVTAASTGIVASSASTGTGGVTIEAATVSGSTGINAGNNGAGLLSITATGAVTGTAKSSSNYGIYANASSNNEGIRINSTAVSGETGAIFASNTGKGDITVTATGALVSTGTTSSSYGIYANNGSNTGSLSVTTSDTVTAAATGIRAVNSGSGDTQVNTSGAVSGAATYGIFASNNANARNLTLNSTAEVSGKQIGIATTNAGKGATTIVATEAITSSGGYGISASNSGTATDLNVNTAAVSGATYGIAAQNTGIGSSAVIATGTVTGASEVGIYAKNDTAAGALTVNAVDVSGGKYGVYTLNNGTSDTTIETSGTVAGASAGMYAESKASAINISNALTGTIQNSSGLATDLAIKTVGGATHFINNGSVIGQVLLANAANNLTNNGSMVGTVTLGDGDNTVLLNADSSATNIVGGAGANNFTVNGSASFARLDGGIGGGDDRLTFDGATVAQAAGSSIAHFETLTLLNGSNVNLTEPLNLTDSPDVGVGLVAIDATSSLQLALAAPGEYALNHHLTGAGLFGLALGAQEDVFTFGAANTAGDFTGTVALGMGQFALSGDNTLALQNASLRLDANQVTTVGTGTQSIGALAFNGGKLAFEVTVPDQAVASGIVQTQNGLDVSGAGVVEISLPEGVGLPLDRPLAPGDLSLFDEQQGLGGVNLQLIESLGPVTGTAGNLQLVDDYGNTISNGELINLAQGGVTVAEATYDYRLSTSKTQGAASDGLYVSYGLTQLNLIGTGADALVLHLDGASGAVSDMGVKITGAGDLVIDAATGTGPGQTISLSGLSNDYSGLTDVRSGSLQLANDGVLGQTAELLIRNQAAVDMAGHSQRVGKLTTVAGSALDFNAGTLTITDGQRTVGDAVGGSVEVGTLRGAGTLALDHSMLTVNGAQTAFSGALALDQGSQLLLNTAHAFDSASQIVLTTAADQLIFGDLSQNSASTVTGVTGGVTGVAVSGAGQVQVLNGMDLTLSADNSYTGGTTIDADSKLSLGDGGTTGSIVGAVANDGTLMFNRAGELRMEGVISGAGVVNQIGSGSTILSAANSYNGATKVLAGSLAAGAAHSFSANSAFQVAAAGKLDLAGFSQTVASLDNAGVISLGGAPGAVLTVTNGYVSNGGSLLINTALGDSNSITDKLVAGSVTLGTGATQIYVKNVGGLGAKTLGNGIQLVQVTGGAAASDAGAFTLGAPVKAGAYEYQLFQNGVSDADGNWYLRSSANSETGSTDPYRAEVPVYMSSSALAARFGLAMLGSCDERSGAYVGAKTANCGDGQAGNGMWGRVFGQTGDVRFGGSGLAAKVSNFEQHGPSYDYNAGGIQVGSDVYRRDSADGARQKAGLYLGGGRVSGTIDRVGGARAGDVSMDAYSFGGYGTYRDAKGWYLDGVAQATAYNGIKASSVDAQVLKTNGWGVAGSLEGGYPMALDNAWSVTPQAQLIYQHLSLGGGQDAYGTVSRQNSDAIYGRIGAKLNRDWAIEGARRVSTFMAANLWHDFGAQATTTFNTFDGLNPVALKTDLGGTWAQVGVGVSGEVAKNVSLSAAVDYNVGLGDQKGSGVGAKLGLTIKW